MSRFAPVLLLFFVAVASARDPIKRLYIEPFTTRSDAQKLRSDLVKELERLDGVDVVAKPDSAEATLDGGGEIWVKGYRSLNPRSGRLPSDGTPIYDGYLSVELKDADGQTFWSYLATPGTGSDNVARSLAKQIARHVKQALQEGEPPMFTVPLSPPHTILKSAGGTFPEPVYAKWFKNYRRANPNLEISYSAIGSDSGIRELLAGDVDFGASDSPDVIATVAPGRQSSYLLFPTVVGAVVPIVNLPGFTGDINLTPEALAGIYLGNITRWNDPALTLANKGRQLPDLAITVVHRTDGSGTSYAWTDYLSHANPEWKSKVGAGLTPQWPIGKSANGNTGVAQMVKELGGSIGYVEYIYALQNRMSFARVRNQQGQFVEASLESTAAAAREAFKIKDDFSISIVDAPGEGAYPISTFTWLVVPAKTSDTAKAAALKGFLNWMLGPGQTQAAALGYLALPDDVIVRERAAINRLQ